METDILTTARGLRRPRQSTVYATRHLQVTVTAQCIPAWSRRGHAIRKVECANHTVKCYRGVLKKLVAEKLGYSGRGKLMLAMRKRLMTATRCAIKMWSTESDAKHATKLLRQDLINGPHHCFGMHSDCMQCRLLLIVVSCSQISTAPSVHLVIVYCSASALM